MQQERRELEIGDGEHVSAVFEGPDDGADTTVVFGHGFGSDKAGSYERRAEIVADEGLAAARFDFRGNNESSRAFGDADLSSRIADLRRVLDAVDTERVGIYGSSFGGLVTIHTAARDDRVDAIALRAPVTYLSELDDMRNEIEETGRYTQLPGKHVGPAFIEDVDGYDTAAIIEDITVSTLIMHGEDDDVVDPGSSRRFFEALSCEKQYVLIPDEGHRFSDVEDERAVRMACAWVRERGH